MGCVTGNLFTLLQGREQSHQDRFRVHQGELVGRISVAERGANLGHEVGVAVNRLCVDDNARACFGQHLVGHLGAGPGAAFHQHLDAEGCKFLDGIRGGGDSGFARHDLLRNPDSHARIDSACPGAAPQCPARCGLPRPVSGSRDGTGWRV